MIVMAHFSMDGAITGNNYCFLLSGKNDKIISNEIKQLTNNIISGIKFNIDLKLQRRKFLTYDERRFFC
jgi:hypothetical protein